MNGLNLGHIQFTPGLEPYTPPERRRRVRSQAARVRRGAGAAPTPGVYPLATGSWLSIHPAGGTAYSPFLGQQRGRVRNSLGASFAGHAIALALILLVVRSPSVAEDAVDLASTNYDIVWIPEPGPGGGGGGGGNESLEMPREVEIAGEDELNTPMELPEELEPPPEIAPEPQEQRLESQNVRISAVPLAAAPRNTSGVLEGLLARSLNSAGSGSDGGAGTGSGGGIGPGDGDGLGPGQGGGFGGGVYQPGNGVLTPQLLRKVSPKYTAEAMRAKIQGAVWVEAVVMPDGTVGDVKVVRSLDRNFGLDEEAIKAALQWRFRPGTRLGEPVRVLVTIELTFTLR